MSKTVHVIGNGPSAQMFHTAPWGKVITCNLPPFKLDDVYATAIVDFKMCRAINQGRISVPGNWICGYRPQVFASQNPVWHMKHSHKILEFYTELPAYVNGYSEFNCGHMATHYAANKLKPKNICLYGFDSMFVEDLTSYTDLYLEADRSPRNTKRLSNNWCRIWPQLFKEFSDIRFTIYGNYDKLMFNVPNNVVVKTKNA